MTVVIGGAPQMLSHMAAIARPRAVDPDPQPSDGDDLGERLGELEEEFPPFEPFQHPS